MSLTLAVFALWTCALLAVGATLATRLAGSAMRGQRFAWAIAMATAVALLLVAPARQRMSAATSATQVIDVGALDRMAGGFDAPLASISHAAGSLPSWLSPFVAVLWSLSSATFIAVFLLSYRRHRRHADRAARATIAGTTVRVVDGVGPAVIGVWRADIVVPSWLLGRPAAEQRLIVRHELSHMAVGDPLLLLAGCAALAVMPWNPAMWYLLGRLRLAIELDCDRRVLAAGARTRDYGAALIELTALLPRKAGGIGAPAFAYRPSHLERRLAAMTAKPMPYRRARLAAAAAVAAVVFVVACDSQLPTSAEIESMSVAEVEAQASPLLRLGTAETRYLVDGVIVSREIAAAVPASKIARIEVGRSAPTRSTQAGVADARTSEVASIHVITTDAPELMRLPAKKAEIAELRRPFTEGEQSGTSTILLRDKSDTASFEGLLVIDGVLVEHSRLDNLDAASISTVEVVKGAAGERLYGPRGAKGVILITTKVKP